MEITLCTPAPGMQGVWTWSDSAPPPLGGLWEPGAGSLASGSLRESTATPSEKNGAQSRVCPLLSDCTSRVAAHVYERSSTETQGDHTDVKTVVAPNWGKLCFSPYFQSFPQYGFIVLIKTYKEYKNPSKDSKCFNVLKDL